jgi:hypothetical protein
MLLPACLIMSVTITETAWLRSAGVEAPADREGGPQLLLHKLAAHPTEARSTPPRTQVRANLPSAFLLSSASTLRETPQASDSGRLTSALRWNRRLTSVLGGLPLSLADAPP